MSIFLSYWLFEASLGDNKSFTHEITIRVGGGNWGGGGWGAGYLGE